MTASPLVRTITQDRLTVSAPRQGRVAFLPFGEMSLKTAKPTPYPAEPTTIGERLKKRRHELGLRQKDVARRLKVNESTVVDWENMKKSPSVRYYARIVRFLGYDLF